jgi:IclR family mhp operon transcriptional activator
MAVPVREKDSILGCISMRFPRSAMSEESAGARYGQPLTRMATAIAAEVAVKRGNG